MKLLLLDQFSDPGGAQQGLLELLPSIRARGWQAVAGFPGHGELFERFRDAGFDAVPVTCGPYSSGKKSLMDAVRFAAGTPVLAREIREIAARFSPDLIYINGPRLLPGVAFAGLRIPVAFHSHSFLFPGRGRRMAGRSLAKCEATVIAACHFVADVWRPFVPAERINVIYNGVAGPAVPRPPVPPRKPATVACIGRIAPEKGQHEFVAAAALIRRAIPDCHFVVYGAALFGEAGAQRYEAELRKAAAPLGVEFAGWVKDVYAVMRSVDLLLVPSAGHEATTRVILEAHAAGVPVIAFRSGGIPEVIEEEHDGWLADSTEKMAALAIELLTGDPTYLADVSRTARETWCRKFTMERYHQELLDTLEKAKSSQR
jgi:glycosyltransferase involved in cell wall biosynthesis